MNLYSDFKLLNENLLILSSPTSFIANNATSPNEKIIASKDIRCHVESAARELSLERFGRFENELYTFLFKMVGGDSKSLGEKVGGILAIRELVGCTSASAESKVMKFARTLSVALTVSANSGAFDLMELVADALGHMAKHSPVTQVDYLEGELGRSLDWLTTNSNTPTIPVSFRRFAACCVLKQLAKNAPTIFFSRVNEFFDLIWGSLCDSKEKIRFSAGEALSACMSVLKERTYHLQWYCYLYEQILDGFHNGKEENVHGSLLALCEALKFTGDFMIPRFKEVCRGLMSLKDHKSKIVRISIISLLPSLAQLCPDAFTRSHLTETVDFLVKYSKTDLRPNVLISTGKLCVAVGTHLVNRIEQLMTILQRVPGKGESSYVTAETLVCISDMVQGLGRAFDSKALSLLEPMLRSGLTPELISTLSIISTHMPQQSGMVQMRLLEEATQVLGQGDKLINTDPPYVYSWLRKGNCRPSLTVYKQHRLSPNCGKMLSTSSSLASMALHPSTVNLTGLFSPNSISSMNMTKKLSSSSGKSMTTPSIQRLSNSGKHRGLASALGLGLVSPEGFASFEKTLPVVNVNMRTVNNDIILLSLRTFAGLSIPASNLIPLMQQSVLPYLFSDEVQVRKEAAITSSSMLIQAIATLKSTRGPSAIAIEYIISRLLEIVISDISPIVRLAVLQSLSGELDKYLARAHHIETLLLLLADEVFDIKMEALGILGRLAVYNPSVTLPSIRFQLTIIISEMKNCPDLKSVEDASLMLRNFLYFPSFHSIVKPYMQTIIFSLPLQSDVRGITAALEALGELSKVLQTDIIPYVDVLLPIIITNMIDSTSFNKQEAAIKALGCIISSTGLVVRPYLQYPQLLYKSMELLYKNESNRPNTIRMELLRTLGLIGALEPTKYSSIISFLENYEKNKLRDLAEDQKPERKMSNETAVVGSIGDKLFNQNNNDFTSHSIGSKVGDIRDRSESVSTVLALKDSDRKIELFKSERKNSNTEKSLKFNNLIKSDILLEGDNADAPAYLYMYEQSVMRSLSEPPLTEAVIRHTPNSDDFYPKVAIAALVKILRDNSLSIHHSTATQTIIYIFRGLGVKCFPFLEQIVPYFLQILRRSGHGLRESVLQQLSQLVSITGHYITQYLSSIIEILKDFWNEHLEYVLAIVQQIAITTVDTFSVYLPMLLPLLLSSINVPKGVTYTSLKGNPANILKSLEQTLLCLQTLRISLRPHIHLIVAPLCKLISHLHDLGHETIPWQIQAISTLKSICSGSKGAVLENCHVILSIIIHTATRACTAYSSVALHLNDDLCDQCITLFITLAQQVGIKILPFDGLIMRSIDGKGPAALEYSELSKSIRNGMWDESKFNDRDDRIGITSRTVDTSFGIHFVKTADKFGIDSLTNESRLSNLFGDNFDVNSQQNLVFNQQQLSRAWDVSQRSTAADWNEWLWRFNIDLLRESPILTLRLCAPLAQAHAPIARELFHAAFVSCWHELSEAYQENLVRALQTAFRSTTIPPEILQTLLNLAEFMEHDVEALPISLSILAELAQKGHAYAKALHYRELEFQSNPAACFESLININKKLDQYEAASGLLKVVEQIQKKSPHSMDVYTIQDSWLAKLGHWDQALEKYNEKLQLNSRDGKAIAGKMKCLDALGRWEEAIKLCQENLDLLRTQSEGSNFSVFNKAAVIGARSAWSLSLWDLMDTFTSQLPPENIDASFMKAVLSVHSENYSESTRYIEQTRKQLDQSITSLLAESYGRAYVPFIMVQQCAELEEIIDYKKLLKKAGLKDQTKQEQGSNLERVCNNSNFVDQPSSTRTFSIPRSPHRINSIAKLQSSLDNFIPSYSSNNSNNDSNLDSSNSHAKQLLIEEVNRRKAFLTEKWRKRIRGCCSSGRAAIPFWKYLLNGRRMVLNEKEDLDTWLDFVSLCRNGGNSALAERVLSASEHAKLSSPSISPGNYDKDRKGNIYDRDSHNPDEIVMNRRIKFAMLKQEWSIGRKMQALSGLEMLLRASVADVSSTVDAQSYLSCLLKLGEWKIAILDPGVSVDSGTRAEVLNIFSKATIVDPNNYRAWHQWGLSNYRAVEESRVSGVSTLFTTPSKKYPSNHSLAKLNPASVISSNESLTLSYVVNAIKGLMRALTLGTRRWSSSVAQDMLCILSLWFKYGKQTEVSVALEAGLSVVHLDNWLGVLPQLIARIDHPNDNVRGLLHHLLIRLGVKHSQALVYPLSVALKSPNDSRKEAAESLMNSLRQNNPKLIDQALLVSQELVRVAILWEENWHWSLEEASRLYFGDGNVKAMLDILVPLHRTLEAGPNTIRESNFCQTYGNELSDAWESIKSYIMIMNRENIPIPTYGANKKNPNNPKPEDNYLHQAWDFYFSVFKKINVQMPQITSLDLNSCSPALHNAQNLDLGVPGTYSVSGQAVRIKSFASVVAIIRSKQRPRKIKIHGEDGNVYVFLLKGHEDLRQDERAMQLFGLVNALLYHDRRTGTDSQDYSIQRYAVIPLSPSAGLISWVPNCDTLHDLIRSYRESRKIMLDVEHKLILQVAPNKLYDSLPTIHKLEVFEYALAYTAGEDLAKILWLKSENSETWLQRRATYTRSLAVMSMVGYILGLGDRHPSNLMLDRETGKVLHIDFGDCFEVAMHRDKFPEKVPFRLTRMLVNAMEVAGIEGNYRSTCEKVMFVLRENSDSLVATLEAFVHDPLVSWRLLNIQKKSVQTSKSSEASPRKDIEDPSQNQQDLTSNDNKLISEESESSTNQFMDVITEEGKSKSKTTKPPTGRVRNQLTVLEPVMENENTLNDLDDDQTNNNNMGVSASQQIADSKPQTATSTSKTVSFSLTNQTIDIESFSKGHTSNSSITHIQPLFFSTTTTLAAPASTSFKPNLHIEMNNLVSSLSSLKLGSSGSYYSHSSVQTIERSRVMSLQSGENNDVKDNILQQELMDKAVVVIRRVRDKLTGLDFSDAKQISALDVSNQVDKLIKNATSNENLSLSFFGWCPFW